MPCIYRRFLVDARARPGQVELQQLRAALHELAHAVLLAGRDHEVLRLLLLQHQPLHLDVVARMAPVALGVQVAEEELGLQAHLDARQAARDLAGDERLAAQRGLVVEEDAVAGIHAIGLAVVDHDPVAVHLGHRIGRARIEGRGLLLRDLLHQAVQLGGAGLVELRLLLKAQDADRFQQAQHAERVGVGGVLRLLERDLHVGLRGQVVDLVRLHLLHDVDQRRRVRHVAVVQDEVRIGVVRVFVDVVDARGVEQRGAALDAVHLIPFGQQKLGQIRAVLPGNSCDQCFLQTCVSLKPPPA